jgi:hypothetical membrane protein
MNGAFVVFGLLVAAGAVLLAGRLPRVAVGALVVFGISSVAVGFVPLDAHPTLHALVATPAFAAQPIALIALGRGRLSTDTAAATATIAVGVASALGVVAFLLLGGGAEYRGATERLALWPLHLWLPVIVLLVRSPR